MIIDHRRCMYIKYACRFLCPNCICVYGTLHKLNFSTSVYFLLSYKILFYRVFVIFYFNTLLTDCIFLVYEQNKKGTRNKKKVQEQQMNEYMS